MRRALGSIPGPGSVEVTSFVESDPGANPAAGAPIFFTKPATALVQASAIPFPPATEELHHEIELVALADVEEPGDEVAPLFADDEIVDVTIRAPIAMKFPT